MGDCRLRILLSKEIGELANETAVLKSNITQQQQHVDDPSSPWQFTITKVYSADTTVVEVCNDILGPGLLEKLANESLKLWDTTVHPPRDISEWPIKTYNKTSGNQSKTLFDAGWFPSGTWQVLKYDEDPKISAGLVSDDSQYNVPEQSTISSSTLSARVQLKDGSSAKPSEVFESVADRFQHDPKTDIQQALQARKLTKEAALQKEQDRNKRLEERLQKLQSGSSKKNEKVSLQVQKMLLKSRCTGSASLKVQDRVYLHIIIVRDYNNAENADDEQQFLYFSRQDTVARILSSLVTNLNSIQNQAELLVKKKSGDLTTYRRLPITMRLYEAIDNKYMEEVDSIVIRCYDSQQEESTMSILDDGIEVLDQDESHGMDFEAEEVLADASMSDDFSQTERAEGDVFQLPERVINALKQLDEASSKTSKKKSSSALEKVRTMKIKSRAKGDAKRVPKIESRFFLELFIATDDERTVSTRTMPVFLARSDPAGRLLRDCVSVPPGHTARILTPSKTGLDLFRVVPQEKSLDMCEKDGLFKCFDGVVVYLHKQQE